jgi:sigma-B regulation protein RsbU (phosphoserine phosphatase)
MQDTKRQLKMISELQRHLLPRQLPQPLGWRLAGYYAPGAWPGGGFYDFFTLPDGRLFLLVADASDQGAPAVALVAILRVVLHSCPLSCGVERLPFCPVKDPSLQPPHIVLGHLNQVLSENSLAEQFVTAWCGTLNPADGQFHFANAGHVAPRWWRAKSGTVETIRDPSGLPLGMDRRASYHHRRILLEPGDLLVLYSNGVTAAENKHGQYFSSDRFDEVLRESAPLGAEGLQAGLLTRLEDFLGGREPQDDVTLLIVERET